MKRAALYGRVSTAEQTTENQLAALRAFATARGWQAVEYVDHGVSGTKERRPALDALLAAVRARKVDVVACVKLDRLARSVRHLVQIASELEALGVDLVILDQGLDTTTPSGRLLFHVLAAIAEFEHSLIVDRVRVGVRRARQARGHWGRLPKNVVDPSRAVALKAEGASLCAIAREFGVHPTQVRRVLDRAVTSPAP